MYHWQYTEILTNSYKNSIMHLWKTKEYIDDFPRHVKNLFFSFRYALYFSCFINKSSIYVITQLHPTTLYVRNLFWLYLIGAIFQSRFNIIVHRFLNTWEDLNNFSYQYFMHYLSSLCLRSSVLLILVNVLGNFYKFKKIKGTQFLIFSKRKAVLM